MLCAGRDGTVVALSRLDDESLAAADELAAPIARVGAPWAPVPVSPLLEDAYLPGPADVAASVAAALGR